MHNRCKDLERSAKLRNIVGVREILGSTVDCVHCFPKVRALPCVGCSPARSPKPARRRFERTVVCLQPFKRAHEELLSVMEVQGKGMPAEEYKRVKDIHELFVVSVSTGSLVAIARVPAVVNGVATRLLRLLQATKKLLKREFATLQVLEWVKKGDIRTMQRYLEAELGDLDLNLQSGKVRCCAAACAVA